MFSLDAPSPGILSTHLTRRLREMTAARPWLGVEDVCGATFAKARRPKPAREGGCQARCVSVGVGRSQNIRGRLSEKNASLRKLLQRFSPTCVGSVRAVVRVSAPALASRRSGIHARTLTAHWMSEKRANTRAVQRFGRAFAGETHRRGHGSFSRELSTFASFFSFLFYAEDDKSVAVRVERLGVSERARGPKGPKGGSCEAKGCVFVLSPLT